MIVFFIILLVIASIVFACITNSPKYIGKRGEDLVKSVLGETEPGKKYVINDYMIDDDGKTSQVDHILINANGIFVIETKNYSGRIYGNDNQLKWTQVLKYGKVKHKFYNPVKQNATHIYRINKLLNEKVKIHSIVVFSQNNTAYIESDFAISVNKLRSTLEKYNENVLDPQKMKDVYNTLINNRCEISNKEHIQEIHQIINKVDNNICPRCGGNLVKREGKYGEFYGCENFPKCKFIKK